jgi:hypothetical protein
VNGGNDLLFARLEEGELDIGEGNIDGLTLDSAVPKPV